MTTIIYLTDKIPVKPKPRIYVCNCDCEAFWLYEDGRIQCMQCDKFHDGMQGQWSFIVEEKPDAISKQETGKDNGGGSS